MQHCQEGEATLPGTNGEVTVLNPVVCVSTENGRRRVREWGMEKQEETIEEQERREESLVRRRATQHATVHSVEMMNTEKPRQ